MKPITVLFICAALSAVSGGTVWRGFQSKTTIEMDGMNSRRELFLTLRQGHRGNFSMTFNDRNRRGYIDLLDSFEDACSSRVQGEPYEFGVVRPTAMTHGYSGTAPTRVRSPLIRHSVVDIAGDCVMRVSFDYTTSHGGFINATPQSLMFSAENVLELREMVGAVYAE